MFPRKANMMLEGSNGLRFPIYKVALFAHKGNGLYVHPVSSNALYKSELLSRFNKMFPVGTTFSFVSAGDAPIQRPVCTLCTPEATKLAQQLIVTTTEFHTSASGAVTSVPRPKLSVSRGSAHSYKAIVFLFLSGGVDSYNMVVPMSGCPDGDMYSQYRNVRRSVALTPAELLPITSAVKAPSSSQVCTGWGVHWRLPTVQRLFKEGDALFLANTGSLIKPTDRKRYQPINGQFNHRIAKQYVQNVDSKNKDRADGVLGRIMENLGSKGYAFRSYSLSTSGMGITALKTKGSQGYAGISPLGASEVSADFQKSMSKHVQNLTGMVSESPIAETWSTRVGEALAETKSVGSLLKSSKLKLRWTAPVGPSKRTSLTRQFMLVAQLIAANKAGHETSQRNAFYIDSGRIYDSHGGGSLSAFEYVDAGLKSFELEMKAQGMWDKVTVVQTSEFGRSLSSTKHFGSGRGGTVHGWGGNYFVAGGAVRGGQILGKYPTDLSRGNRLDVGRGRMVPTTAWDQVWPGIAEWFGVDKADMEKIVPNKANFPSVLTKADMFKASK